MAGEARWHTERVREPRGVMEGSLQVEYTRNENAHRLIQNTVRTLEAAEVP